MQLPIRFSAEAERCLKTRIESTDGVVCLLLSRNTWLDESSMGPEIVVGGYPDERLVAEEICQRCQVDGRPVYVSNELIDALSGKQVAVIRRHWEQKIRTRVGGTWTQRTRTRTYEVLWHS